MPNKSKLTVFGFIERYALPSMLVVAVAAALISAYLLYLLNTEQCLDACNSYLEAEFKVKNLLLVSSVASVAVLFAIIRK